MIDHRPWLENLRAHFIGIKKTGVFLSENQINERTNLGKLKPKNYTGTWGSICYATYSNRIEALQQGKLSFSSFFSPSDSHLSGVSLGLIASRQVPARTGAVLRKNNQQQFNTEYAILNVENQ